MFAGACTTTRMPAEQADALRLNVGGGEIAVHIDGDQPPVAPAEIRQWIETAARAVNNYFGHFPVPRVEIAVRVGGTGKVADGMTYQGRRISIRLGRGIRPSDLASDWMMTHEMFHLGFPELDDDYQWMGEGLSTYLEPLARARIGTLTPQRVWDDFVRDMPQGLPAPGDRGLDNTHTWGRTYWGGATFWLLADAEIRQRTANQRSLDDAIRAIVAAGGDGRSHWDPHHVLEVGDRATGTNVLTRLHEELGRSATAPDLAALWHRLGIESHRGRVTFDDGAPLAAIRRSMTSAIGATSAADTRVFKLHLTDFHTSATVLDQPGGVAEWSNAPVLKTGP